MDLRSEPETPLELLGADGMRFAEVNGQPGAAPFSPDSWNGSVM